MFLVAVFIFPNISFGELRGLLSILEAWLSQSEQKQPRQDIVKEYFKQKEKADREEVARLYKYILTTQTEKYLPPDWRTRTPRQQSIILRNHIQWLEKLSDDGFLNPEEYFEYIKKANPGGPTIIKYEKGKHKVIYGGQEFEEGDIVFKEYKGERKKDYSLNPKYKQELKRAIESSPFKGTVIRFDLQVETGIIEMVVERLIYRGREYGRAKENPGPDNPDNLRLGNFGKVGVVDYERRKEIIKSGFIVNYGNEDYDNVKSVMDFLKEILKWSQKENKK